MKNGKVQKLWAAFVRAGGTASQDFELRMVHPDRLDSCLDGSCCKVFFWLLITPNGSCCKVFFCLLITPNILQIAH